MVACAVAMVAVMVVEVVEVVVVVVVTAVVAETVEWRQWLPRAAQAKCIDAVVTNAVSGARGNLAADAGVAGAEDVAAMGETHREQRGAARARRRRSKDITTRRRARGLRHHVRVAQRHRCSKETTPHAQTAAKRQQHQLGRSDVSGVIMGTDHRLVAAS